jgi:hypothetical protein
MQNANQQMNLLPMNLDNVRVYVGKGNCCRCGCGGEYFSKAEDASHAKKVAHYLKKLQSGKYEVYEQSGLGDEHIYEIQLSKAGHDRVATFYVEKSNA